MSAALYHSITAILPGDLTVAEQEALLLRFVRHRPGLVFHDLLRTAAGDVPVRVDGVNGGRLVRLAPSDAPSHLGKAATRCDRDSMDDFVDVGDVLLPSWGPHDPTFELTIGSDERCVADLEDMAQWVTSALDELSEDEDVDPERVEFLKLVAEAVDVARAERLPLVAVW